MNSEVSHELNWLRPVESWERKDKCEKFIKDRISAASTELRNIWWLNIPLFHRGVGSIFRLRGHQTKSANCKSKVEVEIWLQSESTNLKIILKITPPAKTNVLWAYTLQKPHKVLNVRAWLYNMKRDLIIWTICAFRVLNHHQWSLAKQSS